MTIEELAKSDYGKIVVRFLEEVAGKVADIRRPMNVKPEIENEVRLGVIQILNEEIINKIKVLSGEIEPNKDNWQ